MNVNQQKQAAFEQGVKDIVELVSLYYRELCNQGMTDSQAMLLTANYQSDIIANSRRDNHEE